MFRHVVVLASIVTLTALLAAYFMNGRLGSTPNHDSCADASSEVVYLPRRSKLEDSVPHIPASEYSKQPDELGVSFPDGSIITIKQRSYLRKPARHEGTVVENYAVLSAAANDGDGDAAYSLSGLLKSCENAYRTAEDLADAIDQFHQTRTAPSPRSDGTVNMSGDEAGKIAFIRQMEASYRKCIGVSDSQIAEADQWLAKAAEIGNDHANFELGQRLLQRRDPTAERYLKRSWEAGNADSASHLWHYYTRTAEPEKIDPVTGYAYQYLYRQIVSGFLVATAKDKDPNLLELALQSHRQYLMQFGYELNPREFDEAIDMAKTLLIQNENCCYAAGYR